MQKTDAKNSNGWQKFEIGAKKSKLIQKFQNYVKNENENWCKKFKSNSRKVKN